MHCAALVAFWYMLVCPLWAQPEQNKLLRRYEIADTSAKAKDWRSHIRTTEKFDLSIYRSFPLLMSKADSMPVNPSATGSLNFSVSRNFILSPRGHVFKVTPGLNLYRLQVYPTALKTFPSVRDSTGFERLGTDQLELSVGLGLVLSREQLVKDDSLSYRTTSMLDFGFTLAYTFGSFYKVQDDDLGSGSVLRVPGLPGINPLRLSAYLRISYKVFALYATYRLTPVFLQDKLFDGFTPQDKLPSGVAYPPLPPLELGIGLHIF